MTGPEIQRAQEAQQDSSETQEIIKLTQSRKKIYPDLTTENFEEYKYKKLIEPLRKNPGDAFKIQKEFVSNMDTVEKALSGVGIKSFSYAEAKAAATSQNQSEPYFAPLERQIQTINSGLSTPAGNPNLELLMTSADQAEFNKRMEDQSIIQQVYSADGTFKQRAQKVFDYIQDYRKKNTTKLEKEVIDEYLEEIFSSNKDELDSKIEKSSKIKSTLLDPEQKRSIRVAYDHYHLYRDRLRDQLKLEKTVKQERETFLSKPIEYAKSGERYVAEKIQTMRDHWAGMDGKERTIAGISILIGTAYFLNSDNEGVQKTKDALMKAGLLALGYVGANTTSKVFFGKSLSHMAGNYIEDKSGKRDFLKESFNTDKSGADNMQTSLAVLGNQDFMWLADQYVSEEARYDKFHTPDKHRGISVGGTAENEMSPYNIYMSMKLLNDKLRKKNSSIAKLNEELKKAQFEAKSEGKEFVPPTWAMIITAVLHDQELGYTFDKEGKIKIETARSVETIWETNNKNRTKMWWPLTGRPKDWQDQLADKKPKETVEGNQLNKLSSTIIKESTPLSDVIDDKNFGRFNAGFNSLYDNVYKKRPTDLFHTFEDTGERAMYIASKAKVDTQAHNRDTGAARLAAVEGAYEQALTNLKKKIDTEMPALKNYKDRLSEFVQPIFGTFIGPNTDGAKEYVMFLRLTLPASTEFALRDKQEWPEGNMMQQMHEKQLTTGDVLTRADFKVMADRSSPDYYKKMGFPQIKTLESAFGGAYESFLAKIKLSKDQDSEIDKVLKYYSQKFANSGMTRAGLVRYLATHEFTEEEIKTARGDASTTLPNSGIDVYNLIKKESLDPRIMTVFGNMVVLACNGDATALARIKAYNPATVDEIKRNIAKAINPDNWTPKFLNEVTQTDWNKKLAEIKVEDEAFVKTIETFIKTDPKTPATLQPVLDAYKSKVGKIYTSDSIDSEARKVIIAAMLQDYTQI